MTRHPIYKEIGVLIKARRKKLGMKQETLAGLLGISRGSLANIEIGKQSVLIHQLYNFAKHLQLMPVDLLPSTNEDYSAIERTELPIPDNLKAQQKKQIANLFLQVDTDQILKAEKHAKKSK